MVSALSVPIRPGGAQEAAPQRCDKSRYELRFAGLFNAGRGYSFPCDADGNVDLDSLGGRARSNYYYARALIGREFFAPVTSLVTADGTESLLPGRACP